MKKIIGILILISLLYISLCIYVIYSLGMTETTIKGEFNGPTSYQKIYKILPVGNYKAGLVLKKITSPVRSVLSLFNRGVVNQASVESLTLVKIKAKLPPSEGYYGIEYSYLSIGPDLKMIKIYYVNGGLAIEGSYNEVKDVLRIK